MDQFLKDLGLFRAPTVPFNVIDVVVAVCLAFILSLFIGKLYKSTHYGISYSQSFVQTIIIMSTVVSLIMLIIGSNIARAFSLVGALSIIRFRNAVKESRDIGFMFFAMAIGMACGTRFYLAAIFGTVSISVFIYTMSKLNLFAKQVRERILMIQIPKDLPYERAFGNVLKKYFTDFHLISIETVIKNELLELVFSVSGKKKFDVEPFLTEIHTINSNNKVSLVEGQQQVDL